MNMSEAQMERRLDNISTARLQWPSEAHHAFSAVFCNAPVIARHWTYRFPQRKHQITPGMPLTAMQLSSECDEQEDLELSNSFDEFDCWDEFPDFE
jgi:hypothetical protein